jgi:hypothetical protein
VIRHLGFLIPVAVALGQPNRDRMPRRDTCSSCGKSGLPTYSLGNGRRVCGSGDGAVIGCIEMALATPFEREPHPRPARRPLEVVPNEPFPVPKRWLDEFP